MREIDTVYFWRYVQRYSKPLCTIHAIGLFRNDRIIKALITFIHEKIEFDDKKSITRASLTTIAAKWMSGRTGLIESYVKQCLENRDDYKGMLDCFLTIRLNATLSADDMTFFGITCEGDNALLALQA